MWAFPDERNSCHFAVVTEYWGPPLPAAKYIPNCYRWENRGTERSSQLPKVSSLIRSGGRIHAQTVEVQKPHPFPWSLAESERSETFSPVSHVHVSVHFHSFHQIFEGSTVQIRNLLHSFFTSLLLQVIKVSSKKENDFPRWRSR